MTQPTAALALNLRALTDLLKEAAATAEEAAGLMESGNRDGAMGTLSLIEGKVPDAQALLSAALVLHKLTR